jgi:asparagine synthase (glutamine-hydrolysing)
MCGIAGLVDFTQQFLHLPRVLQEMTDALRHRGPDDEGFAFWQQEQPILAYGPDTPEATRAGMVSLPQVPPQGLLALGHRRLSILDVSAAGHQPMCSADGQDWLVFNGEIYNYLELRDELQQHGFTFRSQTDTEVILAAYRHWGPQVLDHLNGMWAFVLYDVRRQLLFGARDRFGVKPFYYVQNQGLFAFASEQKALLSLPGLPRQINRRALYSYLVEGETEREPQGLFEGILELMPGQAFELTLPGGAFRQWAYYHLSSQTQTETFDPSQFRRYSEGVRAHLEEALRLRLRSDVPLGSCLSGGIDSSALVCLIDRHMQASPQPQVGAKQKVFTASFPGSPLDESDWARRVVSQTQTKWYQVFPKAEHLLRDLEDLVYAQDIPFFSSSTYAQYRVMQLVQQQGLRVSLDGQGADELFSGYSRHFPVFMAGLWRAGQYTHLLRELRRADNSFASRNRLLSEGSKHLLARLVSPPIKRQLLLQSRPELRYLQPWLWQQAGPGREAPRSLNELLHAQLTGPDLKVLLRTADRNAMRFSVEARMPFADHHPLLEYVAAIPDIYKVRQGEGKALLREAMRGVLPEQVRQRRDKIGFATPEAAWLLQLKEQLRAYLSDDLEEYLDVRQLRQDWNRLVPSAADRGTAYLWRLLNFAVWKKVYRL